MKKNEKRMILILLVILIIAVIAFVASRNKNKNQGEKTEENTVVEEFVEVLEDGTKLNISSKLAETKEFGSFKVGNIQLTMNSNQSVLLADIENKTSAATDVTLLDVILYDKEGNELETIPGIVGPLEPGEKTQLNAGITADYANAYDFKVVVK